MAVTGLRFQGLNQMCKKLPESRLNYKNRGVKNFLYQGSIYKIGV